MKKCPFCAEEIQDEAIKCKHCGSLIESIKKEAKIQIETIPPRLLSSQSLLAGESLYFETRPFWGQFFGMTILLSLISLALWPLLILTIIVFFINRAQWKNAVYAITNKRIITQRGVIGKSLKQCALDKVQNIELNVFWYNNKIGNILFDTAGGPVKELTWLSVNNPREVHQKISQIIHV